MSAEYDAICSIFLSSLEICPLCLENITKGSIICSNGHMICDDCIRNYGEQLNDCCPTCKSDFLFDSITNHAYNNFIANTLARLEDIVGFSEGEAVELYKNGKFLEAKVQKIDHKEKMIVVQCYQDTYELPLFESGLVKRYTNLPKWRSLDIINTGSEVEFFDNQQTAWVVAKVFWKARSAQKIGIYFDDDTLCDHVVTKVVRLNDYTRLAPLGTHT